MDNETKPTGREPIRAGQMAEGAYIMSGKHGRRTLSVVKDGELVQVMTGSVSAIVKHCKQAGIRIAAVEK